METDGDNSMSAAVSRSPRRKSGSRAWEFSLESLNNWELPTVAAPQATAKPTQSDANDKAASSVARSSQPPAKTAARPQSSARRATTPHRGSSAPSLPLTQPEPVGPSAKAPHTATVTALSDNVRKPRRVRSHAWDFRWDDDAPAASTAPAAAPEAEAETISGAASDAAPDAARGAEPDEDTAATAVLPDPEVAAPDLAVEVAAAEPIADLPPPRRQPLAAKARKKAAARVVDAEATRQPGLALDALPATVPATSTAEPVVAPVTSEAPAAPATIPDTAAAPDAGRRHRQAIALAHHVVHLRQQRGALRAVLLAREFQQSEDQAARQAELERQLRELRQKLGEESRGRGEALRQITALLAQVAEAKAAQGIAEDRASQLTRDLEAAKQMPAAPASAASPAPMFAAQGQVPKAGASTIESASPAAAAMLDPAHVFQRLGGAEMRLADAQAPAPEAQAPIAPAGPRRPVTETLHIQSKRPGAGTRTVQVVRLAASGAGSPAALPDGAPRPAAASSAMRHSRPEMSLYRGNPESILARSQEREQSLTAERPEGAAAPVVRTEAEEVARQHQRARDRLVRDPLIVEAVRAVSLLRQMDKPEAATPEAGQQLGEVLASLRRRLSGVEMRVLSNSTSKAIG